MESKMRTAAEIRKKYEFYKEDNYKWVIRKVEKMINEARKEAIEECAERAKTKTSFGYKEIIGQEIVDKQSILSLINELK